MLRIASVLLLAAASSAWAANAGDDSCWVAGADAVGGRLWVLCDQSAAYVTDGGGAWQTRPLPESPLLHAIKFVDARRGYIAGEEGTLLATSDGGRTWTRIPLPTTERLEAIQWVGDSGWIAGYAGVILHTSDGGKSWELQNSGVKQPLEGLYFADRDHGWAVGWAGTITRTTDGGRTWKAAEDDGGVSWSLSAVYFRDLQNGWAVGFNGTILRSRDGGAKWEAVQSPTQDWLTSVVFDETGRGWITSDSRVLTSDDGGATWRATTPTEDRLFLTLLVRGGESLWAVGQYGVLRWSGSASAWKQLDPPVKLVVPEDDAEPPQAG